MSVMVVFGTIILLLCSSLAARTIVVPDEAPTIQIALDSLLESDTVYIRSGTYNESLIAPPITFTMIGQIAADSISERYPVIDPSPLNESTELGSLRLTGISARIENVTFRNGAAMYPHNPVIVGGVRSNNGELRLRNCIFDSTYVGLYSGTGRVWLDSCQFIDNQWAALWTDFSRVIANNTRFSGYDCFNLVKSADSSRYTSCQFTSNSGHLINIIGVGHVFTNCEFGPYGPWAFSTIGATDFGGNFLYCIFHDCVSEESTIGISRRCDSELQFVGNLFIENRIVQGASSSAGVSWGCSSGQVNAVPVVFVGNRFVESAGSQTGKCVYASFGGAIFTENRFIENSPPNYSTVHSEVAPTTLTRNIFDENNFAFSSNVLSDARHNYWGDSTGPYHPTLNPEGLGDRVSDSVMFEPWFADTSFLTNTTNERVELPTEFSLRVFPNPFNSTARLTLSVPEPFIASLELINVLGQRVMEIYRGPVYGREDFKISADQLPSGIYFVSIRDVIRNSVNASQKLALIR